MQLFKKKKIFCISYQRTGTTSVGQFFEDFGYKVARYDNKRSTEWSALRFKGDYEHIFNSKSFKQNQVFEDNPWWELDFYKVLFQRFPNSKFILLTRNPDKWFDSMMNHSNGKTLGNTFMHSRLYGREEEFYDKFPKMNYYATLDSIDNLLELNENHREKYTSIYNLRNKEVLDFFNAFSQNSLFTCSLEDRAKWSKLGRFFDIKVPEDYEVHMNKSVVK